MNNKQETENHKPKTVNTLIVGQGLAGSLVAWELMRKGESVAVVDEGLPVTSSKIAAGMFNPINTKRFTVSNNAEANINAALEIYGSMEKELGIELIHRQNIYNVFGNVKEGNDLTLKSDHPFFQQYTNNNPIREAHIIQPFGAFEVGLSGWIDLKKMLSSLRNHINSIHTLVEEIFDYAQLSYEDGAWHYKDIKADAVVFCEGYKANHNSFFTELNIIPCKGDVLEFEAPGLDLTRVVKKGIYIVSLGEGKFKCGSLYKWENDDTTLQQADYDELKQKIESLIDVPFTITKRETAIRPTTKTRGTLFLKHATLPNMFVVNGLGTKGVINGVKVVRQLIETLHS
ncbi:MAG: FAD-dependent oxidoreductase [Bacteroidota bacterium]